MPIVIRETRSGSDLSCVFDLRRSAHVAEREIDKALVENAVDLFDTFPESRNLIGFAGDEPVGAVRVTLCNEMGLPISAYCDVSGFLNRRGIAASGVATMSWICARPAHERNPALLAGLVKMGLRYAHQHGHAHVVAVVHQALWPTFDRIGFTEIMLEPPSKLVDCGVVAAHLDLEVVAGGMYELQRLPYDLLFDESRERRIFQKGEIIFRRGQSGREAFLIMRGSARTVRGDEGLPEPWREDLWLEPVSDNDFLFGPGELIGELSLLDEGPRILTIIGHSREVDVMVLTHTELLEQFRGHPERVMQLAQLLGTRMRNTLTAAPGATVKLELIASTLLDASHGGEVAVELQWLGAQTGVKEPELMLILRQWSDCVVVEHDSVMVTEVTGLRQLVQVAP